MGRMENLSLKRKLKLARIFLLKHDLKFISGTMINDKTHAL